MVMVYENLSYSMGFAGAWATISSNNYSNIQLPTSTVFDENIERNLTPGAKYVQRSIHTSQDIENVLQRTRPRAVFHTASPSMLGSAEHPEIFEAAKINGTGALLDNISTVSATRALAYTASSSVIT
jgi:dTDP-D-glucose 4,6-dehydratase